MTDDNTDDAEQIVRPTTLVTLGGRPVTIRGLTEAQYLQMTHASTVMRSKSIPVESKQKALDRLYRVIRSLVIDPEEQSQLEDDIADGLVDTAQLIAAINAMYTPRPTTVAKVRRGRTPITSK